MTIRLVILATLALSIAACVTGRSTRRGGLPAERVAKYPPDVQASYDLFAARCSRCHTLSRPLNAQITEYTHWEVYVERMRHHAGSGISKADAKKILVFLRHYTDERLANAGGERPAKQSEPPDTPPPPTSSSSDGSLQGAAQ